MPEQTPPISCVQLIKRLESESLDETSNSVPHCNDQVAIAAESLMRSFEIKKRLCTEFRKSKNGKNWIANSTQEVGQEIYFKTALLFKDFAKKETDIRFLNTAIKMLSKCKADDKTKAMYAGCIQLVSESAK